MKFSIRDLLWLTLVVALGVAWLDQFGKRNRAENRDGRASFRLNWLMMSMHESGYDVSFDDRANCVTITPPLPSPNLSAPALSPPKVKRIITRSTAP